MSTGSMGLTIRERVQQYQRKDGPLMVGKASVDGKETNLQIVDERTDVKEPANLHQTLP